MPTIPETLAVAVREHQAGRLDAAEQIYRQVLEIEPEQFDALHLLGLICHATGRHATAFDLLARAVRRKPDFPDIHFNLGKVLQEQGRLDDAVASYRRGLLLGPDRPERYHFNLGDVLREQGQWDAAAACYRQAIQVRPDYVKPYVNLGNVLLEQLKPAEAAECFEKALQLEPQSANAHVNLAIALRELGRLEEAAGHCDFALRLDPQSAEARNNLGTVLLDQGKLEDALANFREATRMRADYPKAWNNLGAALLEQGNLREAMAAVEEAIRRKPDFADAHLSRAILWLLSGDFEQGWPEYAWRLKTSEGSVPPLRQAVWDGSPLAGRTLLLCAEQGLGDTFQFIRYAAKIHEAMSPGRIILACPRSLHPLLRSCRGVDQLVDAVPADFDFDVYAPLLDLPAIFRASHGSVPAEVPYLAADPQLVQRWRAELRGVEGLKVGIAWQGNPKYRWDRLRSLPPGCFEPLGRIDGVRLISLQKGAGAAQARSLADRLPLVDLGRGLDEQSGAFMDTAAVMKNLDLVITSDTAIAHLAGALGVPVWVALPWVPDWRWLMDRGDSPWYPTMRLYRQTTAGDWVGVFQEMQASLAAVEKK